MPPPPADDRTLLQPLSRALDDGADTRAPAKRLTSIQTDQRAEWQAGRRVLAEAYLARYPDLAAEPAMVVELAASEFRLRIELGDNPTAHEYLQRFPEHAAALRRALESAGATADRTQSDTLVHPSADGPASKAETLPAPASPPKVTANPSSRKATASNRASVPGYEILGELGRGAMGVVYRARQKALGREVALKMVLSGQFAGPHELERFRIEAVQLAKLAHPNIVQIYEIGEFDERPYFAMEFIPGGSLAKLLEKKPLASRPAAELVATLARAIHHAHERGIIHRDLKPANVMLAADGQPKITDFGLAKGGGTVGDTASYAILGTPSYMAPEQASGHSRDVGPGADIYALGSILYEALTGRPPFRAASVLDTIQLVLETEPVPPGDLTAHLPRDVETITLKCLQKDLTKRYASAADLAADLQRFLDDQPIRARPAPAWEKTWKWAKRRPAWAALIGTVFAAVAGLMAAGIWFNARLRNERNVAVANANLAEERFQENREAIDRYFTEVSESDLLDEPGLQPLREKLLKLARDYYARFVEERRNDPAVRADLARSLGRLARISAELKDPREAIALHAQALPILEELAATTPDDPAPRGDIASTWYELSKLYRQTNQTSDAAAACDKAIRQWTELAEANPAAPRYRAELARAHISQSNLDFMMSRLGPAGAACERALNIRQKLVADDPKNEIYTRDLATAWDNLANIRAVAHEPAESTAARRQASDLFRKLVAANPYRSLYRNDLARAQFNLGTSLLSTNQPQPAVDALREAASEWERLRNLYPAVREYQVSEANALFALSQTEWRLGQFDASDQTLAQARTVRAELVKQFQSVPEYGTELARCDALAGDHAMQRNQPARAAEAFQRAVEQMAPLVERHKLVPRYSADLARDRLNLGKALALAGKANEGRQAIQQSLQSWTALKDDPALGTEAQVEALDCLAALGDLERRAGRPGPAIEWFDRCLRMGEPLAKLTPSPAGVRSTLKNAWWGKAEVLTTLRDYPDAIAAWDHAIALAEPGQLFFLKVYRLATLARTAEYEQALIELDPLAVQARANSDALFQVAKAYALAARTAAADAKLPFADRNRRASEIADRAIENLKLAKAKGYFSTPAGREALDHDPDWEFLRARPDFRRLIADTTAPSAQVRP